MLGQTLRAANKYIWPETSTKYGWSMDRPYMMSESNEKKIVVFSHANCAPCRSYEKIIQDLSSLGWSDRHFNVIKHRGKWELPIYPITILFVNNEPKLIVSGVLRPYQLTTLFLEEKFVK